MVRILLLIVMTVYPLLSLTSTVCHAAESDSKEYFKESVHIVIDNTKAQVSANETLKSESPSKYAVENLFDGNKHTAWVTRYHKTEDDSIDPNAAMLRIVFDEPVYVNSIDLMNGYQKTESLFSANQRAKSMYIEKILPGGRSFPLSAVVNVKDIMGKQTISLTDDWTSTINLFPTKELVLNVAEVFGGSKYADLCISEIGIILSNSVKYSPSDEWDSLKRLIDTNKTESSDGWDWAGLYSNDYQLFNDFLYYVLIGNKEASLYFADYEPEGIGTSEVMRNIYRPALKEMLDIKAR